MIFLFFLSIPNVDVLQVDVTNEAHIAKAAEHVKQKYGKLEHKPSKNSNLFWRPSLNPCLNFRLNLLLIQTRLHRKKL